MRVKDVISKFQNNANTNDLHDIMLLQITGENIKRLLTDEEIKNKIYKFLEKQVVKIGNKEI